MFFMLSKIFWMLAQPRHWLGFLILATALSLLLRWNRVAGFAAARRYPGARQAFSGGSGALGGTPFPEAETVPVLLIPSLNTAPLRRGRTDRAARVGLRRAVI